jgi:hypothetical protein
MMLHITNGDAAAHPLRSAVDGRVVLSCDVLYEGPAGATIDLAAWHAQRARVLARDRSEVESIRAGLAAADAVIASAAGYDETVLWFEHDLFDQLLIPRTISLLPASARVSLVCIGAFPGVTPFYGLGQLRGEQLATLLPGREPVTIEHRARAREVWDAFQSPDPLALQTIMVNGDACDAPFPFLRGALRRLFEEYPSMANGLSRTEQAALRNLEAGALTGRALFAAAQRQEEAPFMGDTTFFAVVDRLRTARVPLVAFPTDESCGAPAAASIQLTEAGREVLAGRADHIRLNGLDRWRGGVHLTDQHNEWRWDSARQTLVSW